MPLILKDPGGCMLSILSITVAPSLPITGTGNTARNSELLVAVTSKGVIGGLCTFTKVGELHNRGSLRSLCYLLDSRALVMSGVCTCKAPASFRAAMLRWFPSHAHAHALYVSTSSDELDIASTMACCCSFISVEQCQQRCHWLVCGSSNVSFKERMHKFVAMRYGQISLHAGPFAHSAALCGLWQTWTCPWCKNNPGSGT